MGSGGSTVHPACIKGSISSPVSIEECENVCSNDPNCKGYFYYTKSSYQRCHVAISDYPNCPTGYIAYSGGTVQDIVNIGNCRSSGYSACFVKGGKQEVDINTLELKYD